MLRCELAQGAGSAAAGGAGGAAGAGGVGGAGGAGGGRRGEVAVDLGEYCHGGDRLLSLLSLA